MLFELSSLVLIIFPEYAGWRMHGHCPVAVSVEADERWFHLRDDEDQQLSCMYIFLSLFLLLYLYVVCDTPTPPPQAPPSQTLPLPAPLPFFESVHE